MQIEKYEELGIIKSSENGYSIITEIKDINTEKHYARKTIKGINTPLHNVIFEREVGALNKLRTCDNIVRLEHYDISDDETYGKCGQIFMEYINGSTLQQLDVIDLSNPQKFSLVQQLINAIQVAHENNIIHRDISPKNIMVTQDYIVKLIDFGISKIKDMVNTDTLYQFATNKYAAPEVHRHSENATESSDIYSLGAVIYFIFTGEEPPIADEFETKLYKSGGIDTDLKEIINKMTRISSNERYKNIFEVKKALNKLFKRFSKSDRTYIVSIDTGKIFHMKNLSLVPNTDQYKDIIENNIYEDFLESYIFIEDEDSKDERYLLYGTHYSFECIYDTDKQLFQVINVNKLQPHKRESNKRKSMFINGDVKFIQSGKAIPENNNFELTNDIKDNKRNYLSSSNVNNEYTKNFFAWHKLLQIMETEVKNNVIKISYDSYDIEESFYVFSIKENDYYLLDENTKESIFIYEKDIRNKSKVIEIGNFDSIYHEEGKFFLKIRVTNKQSKMKLPKSGIICEDFRRNLALINRERKALNAFNNEDYVSTSNLKSIFSGVENSSSFAAPNTLNFHNEELDSAQKKAVTKSLNSKDISLIQGPPGTGKTNVIIEILRQILQLNSKGKIFKQKILLVSQAHTAVDKMLEDLDKTSHNNKVIRIGRDENLSDIVKEKYAVDYAQERWVDRIVNSSNAYANKLLSLLIIDEEDFNKYYEAKMQVKFGKESDGEKTYNNSKHYINSFEVKYQEILNKKDFESLMIQRDWVNRITGRMDIQQHFIKNAEIISGTCTGVVSNHVIKDMVFDYVIIDEAAKATFPELLISIVRAKKIIMVGDHKQLPPILDDELIKGNKKVFNDSDLDMDTLYDSIFKKLFDHISDENKHILNTQYRMHPTIGTMISKIFYDNNISNGVPLEKRVHNIIPYKDLAILWIDTSNIQDRYEEKVFLTYRNLLEANIVKEQLKLINNFVEDNDYDVGVITPYSGQKNLIRNETQQIDYNNLKNRIIVNSVDAFQGGQKDIIIYSTVRSSNRGRNIGFLKSEERLNVAFSRAKRLLIIVGDAKFLNNTKIEGNKFPEIISYIKSNKNCEIVDYKILQKNKGGI